MPCRGVPRINVRFCEQLQLLQIAKLSIFGLPALRFIKNVFTSALPPHEDKYQMLCAYTGCNTI